MLQDELLKLSVKEHYKAAVADKPSCCCSSGSKSVSLSVGYSPAEIEVLPEGADLGLGCGNPGAIAHLKPGEVVIDLGSGAGIDCLLAARKVGEAGKVVGVDMTPEMVYRARTNAAKSGLSNVEFRLGEIEHLPIESNFADVILSNCVINLSTDKPAVWREAFRTLKPGGRLAISDIVAISEPPAEVRNDAALWSCCAAGASSIEDLRNLLEGAGFHNVEVKTRPDSRRIADSLAPGMGFGDYFASAEIEAIK